MTALIAWGVHMPEWVGDDPIDQGYVAIGWPELGDVFAMPADRNTYKEALKEAYPDKKAGAIPVDAGTLFKFAHELKKGDLIIHPSKHNRMVNIGYATGKKWHNLNIDKGDEDLPNFVGVDWKLALPRSDFPQSALNEIGSFLTLFRVRKHDNDFYAKLGNNKSESHENEDNDDILTDDAAARNTSQLAEENAQDFIVRRLHSELTGYEFEDFISHLMECMGYTSRVTPKSGDGGVDVIAHSDKLGFEPPIIKIQCKRQTTQIDEASTNQLLGTLGQGEFALFVTLGSYSRPAVMNERNNSRLRLIDGETLVELILKHYAKLAPRYRLLLPLKQIYVPDL